MGISIFKSTAEEGFTSVIQPSVIHDNVNNIQGDTLDDPQLFSGALWSIFSQTAFILVSVFYSKLTHKTSTDKHHS